MSRHSHSPCFHRPDNILSNARNILRKDLSFLELIASLVTEPEGSTHLLKHITENDSGSFPSTSNPQKLFFLSPISFSISQVSFHIKFHELLLIFPIRATCPAHRTFLDFTNLIIPRAPYEVPRFFVPLESKYFWAVSFQTPAIRVFSFTRFTVTQNRWKNYFIYCDFCHFEKHGMIIEFELKCNKNFPNAF
jgi:hypothetical protein